MNSGVQDIYECLCAALRMPLCQATPALISTLKGRTAEDIAGALRLMTNDEATLLFDWLDNERAVLVLGFLPADMVDYVLRHAPPGRLANLDLSSVDAGMVE